VLSGFLTELLQKEVNVQEILESEGNTASKDDKVNRLDLKAKIDNGELAVFEIQFFDQIDFLGKVLFNACKAVVEQVSSGELYDIKRVYSVNIAYFDLGAKKEYVFCARLSKFTGVHFADEYIPFSQSLNPPSDSGNLHPEYYLILPNKFDEQMRNRFDEWVYTLKTSKIRSEFTAAGIQAAGEKLDVLKMAPQQRAEYERTRAADMSQKSIIYTAELKGETKKSREIAKNLKLRGMSNKEISEITGLSIDEINAI
jgi:predicted transposase/invertase (TIGR01784 family)